MKKSLFTLLLAIFSMTSMAQSFEPKWTGEVAILKLDGDTVSIPTEKSNVQIKTGASLGKYLVGIGNIKSKVTIKGGRSTTQISPDEPIYLVVKCKDNQNDPTNIIQVVKFEEKKKDRKAELLNVDWKGSVSQGNMTYVPFEADTYGKNSYILKIDPAEGEFGVRVLDPNDSSEKVNIFYCFGAHKQ